MSDPFLDLFGDDPELARAQAKALADAMRRRKAAGTVATVVGGPFAQAGRAFLGEAEQSTQGLLQAGQTRAQMGLQRERLGQDASQFGAQQEARAAEQAATERYRGAQLGLARDEMGLKRQAMDMEGERKAGAADAARAGASNKAADDLRNQFQGLSSFKNTQVVAESFRKAQSASGTAAGDMSLIFGYMKLLDPGSAVKEGEYANASNAAGVPDRIRTFFNKAKDGEILAPNVRENFKQEARRVFGAQMAGYQDTAKAYRQLAEARGANPAEVVLDLGLEGLLDDGPALSAQDAEAKAWAEAHPNDPRSAKILQRLSGGR